MHSNGYRHKLADCRCSKCGKKFQETDMRISPTLFSSSAGYYLDDQKSRRLLWTKCSHCHNSVSLSALGIREVHPPTRHSSKHRPTDRPTPTQETIEDRIRRRDTEVALGLKPTIDAPPSTEDPLGHSMPKPTREEVDDGEGA